MPNDDGLMVPLPRLDGNVAMMAGGRWQVAGGKKGPGGAVALRFAKSDARVVVASRRVDDCEADATEVRSLGCRLLAVGSRNPSARGDIDDRDSLRVPHATRRYTGHRPLRLNP
jgi:NAD(P)-dependent dehydrogenase (short-subunit alcohol dehydrogenase family)